MGMQINLEQKQKLEQRLVITPLLKQAIELLQLSTLELKDKINDELLENPFLEEDEDIQEEQVNIKDDSESDDKEYHDEIFEEKDMEKMAEDFMENKLNLDSNWMEYFKSGSDYSGSGSGGDGYNKISSRDYDDFFERVPAKEPSLQEHLNWQLRLNVYSEEELQIGEEIIGNIDDKGYLQDSLENIGNRLGCDINKVIEILELIQTFEPYGVGARDLQECLLIQLKHISTESPWIEKIVKDFFPELQKRNYNKIRRKLKLSKEALTKVVNIIAVLDPQPGSQYDSTQIRYVYPDLIVEETEDNNFVIILNDEGIPKLRISPIYKKIVRSKADLNPNTQEFLYNKYNAALWLMKSISQRRTTLYQVGQAIFEVQHDFLKDGIRQLKPLVLKDIADRINKHEATVSRVTSNKYVQTPRGIFKLKYFFGGGVENVSGEIVVSKKIKEIIKDLISQEDPKRPLSDSKLVKALNEKGILIARRTVAKYREALGILSSRGRKNKL